MYKRMFSVMLSIVLFCFCWQVQASEVVNNTKAISGDNTIQPYYNYTSRIEVSLAASSSTVTIPMMNSVSLKPK